MSRPEKPGGRLCRVGWRSAIDQQQVLHSNGPTLSLRNDRPSLDACVDEGLKGRKGTLSSGSKLDEAIRLSGARSIYTVSPVEERALQGLLISDSLKAATVTFNLAPGQANLRVSSVSVSLCSLIYSSDCTVRWLIRHQ